MRNPSSHFKQSLFLFRIRLTPGASGHSLVGFWNPSTGGRGVNLNPWEINVIWWVFLFPLDTFTSSARCRVSLVPPRSPDVNISVYRFPPPSFLKDRDFCALWSFSNIPHTDEDLFNVNPSGRTSRVALQENAGPTPLNMLYIYWVEHAAVTHYHSLFL